MSTETALVDVLLPAPGTSIAEGTVLSWHRRVGDRIEANETICEISSDKIDVECPAPVGGIVEEILVEENETVPVGTVLARIRPEGGVIENQGGEVSDASVSPPNRFISPVARRIAAERGVDLNRVAGTGRGGRVTKRDVLAASSQDRPPAVTEPQEQPVPQAPERESQPPLHGESPYHLTEAAIAPEGAVSEPLSHMRQTIGAAMLRSQATAATCHTMFECDMTEVETLRREFGITALPLLAMAVVEALAEFPDLNATLDGDTITRYSAVHLGIAVSLGEGGLIVPVIRDAQNLSAMGLSEAIRDLANRARAAELSPQEVGGATFTITNPGAYGAVAATPIIDLPQVGILDFEAVIRRPVVITADDGTESIGIRPMANLILGWDHRAIDGVYAARFLAAIKARLTNISQPRTEDQA